MLPGADRLLFNFTENRLSALYLRVKEGRGRTENLQEYEVIRGGVCVWDH